MSPDERLFKAHLEEASFQSGVDAGKWGLRGEPKDLVWPYAVIWVAADKEVYAPEKIYLRFDLTGYPTAAPTSCPWNIQTNQRLEDAAWPRLTGKFRLVFRHDWQIKDALYAPCDRLAMAGHQNPWEKQFPMWWWQPKFTIVKYLTFVHLCLNPNRL